MAPKQLISLVAHGDIDYAVCDESIARAVADSLSQIDINTAISLYTVLLMGSQQAIPRFTR